MSSAGYALVGVNFGDEPLVLELPSWLPGDKWRPLLGEPSFSEGKLALPAWSVGVLERPGAMLISVPKTQRLRFAGPATGPPVPFVLAGAGEPFGNWDPTKAPSTEVELELPVYAVLEYKLVFDWRQVQESEGLKWEEGENRYLLVEPSSEPVTVEVGFRRPPEEECDGSP